MSKQASENDDRLSSNIAAALPLAILMITALSIPLAAAQEMGLSPAQTASWILVLWGLPSVTGLALALVYRQPLSVTGSLFIIIFVASLAAEMSFAELVGAFIIAGAFVAVAGVLGIVDRFSRLVPTPIMFGMLAGAVLPFVSDIFTALGEAPATIGTAIVVYLVSRRLLGKRLPPVLPALVAALALAMFLGEIGPAAGGLTWPVPVFTSPVFSLSAILTVTPVVVALMLLQANVPSFVYLRSQGYRPPERVVSAATGLLTAAGSLFGPAALSLSLPATAMIAAPTAGAFRLRHRSVYILGAWGLLIGLLAGVASDLAEIVPLPLLLALAGLAVIDLMASALEEVTKGPLLLGPLFAFAIALSDISFLGFGPFFWSLVVGTAVSLLLEGKELRELRQRAG